MLNLSHNNLEKLPASINQLRKLQYLFINSNRITNLPDLFDLVDLEELNLDSNLLVDDMLPSINSMVSPVPSTPQQSNPSVGSPRQQEIATLSGSQGGSSSSGESGSGMQAINSFMGATNSIIDKVRTMVSSSSNLRAIGSLISMHTICLKSNKLSNLPDILFVLPKIQKLDISMNSLSTVDFPDFPLRITFLDLSFNCIKELSPTIGSLGTLKV